MSMQPNPPLSTGYVTMRRSILHFSCFLVLFSCTLFKSPSGVAAEFPAEQVTSYLGSPLITFDRAGGKISTDVLVFLSPSCNYCNSFYRDLMAGLKDGSLKLDGKRITVVMFSRNEEDIRASKNLLCVGHVRFPAAYNDYQRATYRRFWGRVIDRGWAEQTSANVAAKYGVTTAELSKCQADEKLGASVALVHRIGASIARTLPLVIINGQKTAIDDFRRLRRELS